MKIESIILIVINPVVLFSGIPSRPAKSILSIILINGGTFELLTSKYRTKAPCVMITNVIMVLIMLFPGIVLLVSAIKGYKKFSLNPENPIPSLPYFPGFCKREFLITLCDRLLSWEPSILFLELSMKVEFI